MNIIDRGFLLVLHKQAFLDWSNSYSEVQFSEGEIEPSIYLIEEGFFEEDKVVESLFKKILFVEMASVTEDEEEWPAITRENFDAFFTYTVGSTVIDTIKNSIQREEI